MRQVACAALAVLTVSACAAEARPPANLSWLSGYWLSCDGGQQVTETWSAQREGVMVGSNLTSGGGKASWEFFRIGPSGAGVSYFAMPSGQAPAEFPLSTEKSTETKLVFENLKHDFPQRVIYAREGAALTARIEGMMDGKLESMDWRFASAPLNQPCPG
ncbi:MAG: DUF6265 family protein [Hyphomonadaceae bacterium]